MRRRALLSYCALGLGAVAASLFVGWWQVDGPGAPEATTAAGRPLPLTAMDFALTDHEGQPVGPETLIGQPSLVFFGFTWCPQVCPTTLADISHWLDGLGTEAETLATVLITVDPERDTVDAMAEYVGYFHPQIRGWTGSAAEIARAAEGFRVRYERVPFEAGDYTMNHTAGVFLFDASGALVSIIDHHEPREFALPKIRRALTGSTPGTG
jgi:protein SCO1/2